MPLDPRRLPTPPGNPLVHVPRFLPRDEPDGPPWLGSLLAELFALTWWQSPCLNMSHHWLTRPRMRFPVERPASLVSYAEELTGITAGDVVVTGTYHLEGHTLSVRSVVLVEGPASRSGKRSYHEDCSAEWEGPLEAVRWVAESCANQLTERWFAPGHEFQSQEPPIADCSLEALQWFCAACDFAALGRRSLRNAYLGRALNASPRSAYLRFMAHALRRDALLSPRLCEQLVRQHPSCLPAYFPHDWALAPKPEWMLARRLILDGLAMTPFNTHGFFELQNACITLEDVEPLLPYCRLHVARGTFASPVSQLGAVFESAAETANDVGQYTVARRFCEEGLKIAEDPLDVADLLYERARAREQLGEMHEAGADYRRARELSPSTTRLAAYVRYLLRTHQGAEAETLLREALGERGELDRGERHSLLELLSRTLASQGKHRESERLRRLLTRLPVRDADSYLNALHTWEGCDTGV